MGATYTRQSSYTDGDVVQAADSNDEFNQLAATFAAASGHSHDGTGAEGGPITKLLGTSITIGNAASGTDITVTFDGESNDGVLKWMEDEDYFEFSDDILVASTEKLQFRDTAIYINSSADGQLDLVADTEIQIAATTIDINGNVDVSGTLTVAGAVDFGDAALSNVGAVQLDSISGDGDTDTSITFSGSNVITVANAGTNQVTFNDGSIAPVTDSDVDLGTNSLRFKDVYIDSATVTGEVAAASLDISGNVDIDGTLETDALSINSTTVTSTAAELNILDGVTATAAEINALDGITSTVAELNILDGVTAFLDEDNMASNSATGIASQQSIKAYVDTQITAEDLDVTTDSGTIAIDLDSETLTVSGGTGLDSSATGNAVTLAIDSTVATLTGSQTLTNKSLTAPTLTGTAVVASLDISGDIDVDGTTNLDVVDIDGAVNIATTALVTGVLTTTATQVATGGITSGSDIVSDTDSTDDLGTTSVRWANLFVDGITATDQITATGFTGTLDGILGSGTAAAATVTTLDTSGAVNLNLVTDSSNSTSGALIVDGGVGIAKKLYVGTDLDVDGTTNLDAVDIDGAVQLDATLTIGANDQGYDVILYGDTASANLTWDTSADDLILNGAAGLIVPDGQLTLGSTAVTSTAAELNILDGVTATTAELNYSDTGAAVGTVVASKVVTADANKDVASFRNITLTGELDAGSLDVSGDADIDGTLEADAITVNGTALNTVIAGVTVANATLAATTTVTDSTANTNFPVVFHDESNALLDDTGALRYNPSTGQLLVPNLTVAGTTTQVDTVTMEAANAVVFEGATADDHETTLTIIDPTADRTINLPNQSGTVPVLAAASNTAVTSTPEELNILDGVTSTAAELNILDGVTSTAAELNILDGVTSTAAELNALDGITAVVGELNALDIGATAVGTAVASKAVILDSNKDYTGVRNLTISGEIDAATGDFSGDVDIDGTLEADAITINGTAIASVLSPIAGGSGIVTTGALNSGSITSGFGTIDTGSSAITTTGLISGGSLDIDNVLINGTTIGHTDDTDLITVADGLVTVAGEVQMTTLDIGGTNVTSTAAELNILDGVTSTAAELNILDVNNSTIGDLTEISTAADNDVLLAIDTSGGGLKKITRSAIIAGTGSSGDMANLVEDETPQLGGNLDTNSQNILIDDAHFIGDESGNEQIVFKTTGSAVNHVEITNNASGSNPILAAAGGDTNIGIALTPKGTGEIVIAAGNLNYGGAAITATGAELNLIDGGTARGTTAVADGDGILINDAGTMRMTTVQTVSAYMAAESVGGGNIVTTGALNSGTITSGFGNINTGSSTITTTGAVATGALTSGGIIKTDDTTAATSTTDGSLQTDGGLSVAADAVIGDDLFLLSDAAVLTFGAGKDVTLTHVHDTGILLNGTSVIQFNDASQNIGAPSATVLDINATDEIELNATLVDVNANLDVSGTITSGGVITGTAFTAGSAVLAEAELEMLDGITAGTVAASKAVVVDANKDVSSFRNITASATVNAVTVDFGNWTVTESSGVLIFATGGNGKMKLDASGNLTIVGDLNVNGSI